jgi:hypothetical protein
LGQAFWSDLQIRFAQREFDCGPIDIGNIKPQPDPAFVAYVLRHMKLRGRKLLQYVMHVCRRFAVERDATVAMMVGEKPAEAFRTHCEAKVCALRDRGTLRQTLDDADDPLSLLI